MLSSYTLFPFHCLLLHLASHVHSELMNVNKRKREAGSIFVQVIKIQRERERVATPAANVFFLVRWLMIRRVFCRLIKSQLIPRAFLHRTIVQPIFCISFKTLLKSIAISLWINCSAKIKLAIELLLSLTMDCTRPRHSLLRFYTLGPVEIIAY